MRHFIGHARRVLPILGLAANCIGGIPGAALAMGSCSGEFSSTALRPLPKQAVVAVDLTDSSDLNTSLAGAFTNGMKNAGARVTAPSANPAAATPPATVTLRLSYSILGQGGRNGQGGGGNGSGQWSGNSQTFLQGGINRARPDIPRYDAFQPGPAVQSALLFFRVEAHDAATGAIDWIGSVQCTMKGSDNQALAYQLGRLIGGAIGERRDRVSM